MESDGIINFLGASELNFGFRECCTLEKFQGSNHILPWSFEVETQFVMMPSMCWRRNQVCDDASDMLAMETTARQVDISYLLATSA